MIQFIQTRQLIIIVLFFTFLNNGFSQTLTPPSEGNGSSSNPYQIETPDHLYWLSQSPGVWNNYFIQTADINGATTNTWNMGDHDNNPDTEDQPLGFTPIGNNEIPFTGNYNGQGYMIDSLMINQPTSTYLGFFGNISNSELKNIHLTNINYTGLSRIGGLSGNAMQNSIITNIIVTGEIYSTNTEDNASYCGGLAGYLFQNSLIKNSHSNVKIETNGGYFCGGISGVVDESVVQNTYSTGSISCGSYAGGITPFLDAGSVLNSYSASQIEAPGQHAGIVAINISGEIEDSFWNTDSCAADSNFGQGISTSMMQLFCRFANRGWDFLIEKTNGEEDIWGMNENVNGGMPFLAIEGFEHTEDCCGFVDLTPPVIPTLSNLTIQCETILQTPVANDLCAGDIPGTTNNSLTFDEPGTYTIFWSFDDGNGNVTEVPQEITKVADEISPTLICREDFEVNANENNIYKVSNQELDPVEVNDNCGLAALINDFNYSNSLDGVLLQPGSYQIKWKAEDVSGNTRECEFIMKVNAHVGISEELNPVIKTFPNPVNYAIHVESSNNYSGEIKLFNTDGRLVKYMKVKGNSFVIDLSGFENGIYIMQMENNHVIHREKIVKQ